MLKYLFIVTLFLSFLDAKNSVTACIPIGTVIILKKSIMTLHLSKKQKQKLYVYEEKLKDDLEKLKESAKNREASLSGFFDKNKFLPKKFEKITKKENKTITAAISEYFTHMYATLTKEQKAKLIKRFKRIERKRRKSHTQ